MNNNQSIESIIVAIKGMFSNEHFEVKIITTNTYDHYLKQQIPQHYECGLIFIDENNQEHKTVWVKEKDTIPIYLDGHEKPLCGCDASETGRTLKSSVNKLYSLCKKMKSHKYGLYNC